MIYYLLLTAFTVSIDSFVCGFALSLRGKKKYLIVLGIFLTVLAMCFIANYLAIFLSEYLTEKTASLGGLILIGVGIWNLFKKDEDSSAKYGVLKQSLISGFAVGLDGAAANLSLSITGINSFYVPIVIAAMHALTISLGILLSQTKLAKKFGSIKFIPPVILILLGIYKTLGFFI